MSKPTPALDFSQPSPARIWNYFQGGRDNYRSDRALADVCADIYEVFDLARITHLWHRNVVNHLVTAGIRQFLDIGTGLPATPDHPYRTARDLHGCRIVCVDTDVLALAHLRALFTTAKTAAASAHLLADLREPAEILHQANMTLDFRHPVAVVLGGVAGHITSYLEAHTAVQYLATALPTGSYLALWDATNTNPALTTATDLYNTSCNPYALRPLEKIAALIDGLEMVAPELWNVGRWRPHRARTPSALPLYGALGRKTP